MQGTTGLMDFDVSKEVADSGFGLIFLGGEYKQ